MPLALPLPARLALAALALAGGVGAAASVAASPEPPFEAGFHGEVDLDVVEVVVVVVDGDGRPVPGLGAEDFELRVDGEATAITQFYADPGAAVAAVPPRDEGPAPSAVRELRSGSTPVTVAILVDEITSQPSLRQGALAGLETFVAGLSAGSQITVARSEAGVEVVLPLTDDLQAARSALQGLAARPAQGGRRRAEEQLALEELVGIHELFKERCSEDEIQDLYRSAAMYSRQRRLAAEASLRAPTVVAKAMAALPGRRLLVHLGGGVESEPGRRVYEAVERLCPASAGLARAAWPPERSLLPDIERATLALLASGVTVYSFDLGGRELEGTLGSGLPFLSAAPAGAEVADRLARQDALFSAASDTGGRAFLDLARAEPALAEMRRDLGATYSLGFVPDHPAEGAQHRLRVECRRPGLEVRHRRSYRHATPDERARGEALAALAGTSRLSVLGATAQVGRIAARNGEKRRFDVSLWLRVPLRELALSAGDDGALRGNLHLYLTARDEHDRESPIQAVDVPLTVPPSRVASGDLLYEIKAVMRPGHHRLALRVEDLRSGAADLLDLEVEVAPPS